MKQYKIIKELNLIVHYISGNVSFPEIIEIMSKLVIDPDYSKYYDVITDLRDSNLVIDARMVNEFVFFVSHKLKIVNKRKIVYITNKPNEVALTMLLSNAFENSEPDFFICSTEGAVVHFLNKPNLDREILIKLINEIIKIPSIK